MSHIVVNTRTVLDVAFTDEEVTMGLGNLKSRKGAGADGLPAELLKNAGARGVRALTNLFNAASVIVTASIFLRAGGNGP